MKRSVTIFFLSLTVLVSGIHAASLTGTILDDAGVPVRAASVYLESNPTRTSLSDSSGAFSFFLPRVVNTSAAENSRPGMTLAGHLLRVHTLEPVTLEMSLSDLSGKVLLRDKADLPPGNRSVNLTGRLSSLPGPAILRVTADNGMTAFTRLVRPGLSFGPGSETDMVIKPLTKSSALDRLIISKRGYTDIIIDIESYEAADIGEKHLVLSDPAAPLLWEDYDDGSTMAEPGWGTWAHYEGCDSGCTGSMAFIEKDQGSALNYSYEVGPGPWGFATIHLDFQTGINFFKEGVNSMEFLVKGTGEGEIRVLLETTQPAADSNGYGSYKYSLGFGGLPADWTFQEIALSSFAWDAIPGTPPAYTLEWALAHCKGIKWEMNAPGYGGSFSLDEMKLLR